MTKSRLPPALLFLAGYTVLVILFGSLLALLRGPSAWLIVLAVPVGVAALFYSRTVYLTMIAVAGVVALIVLYALKPNVGPSVETLILVTLNAVIAGELIYRVIAGRVRAEEATRASEERYRLLFERSLTGVYRATLDGYILECNDAFARVLGYPSREDMLVRWLGDLYDDAAEYRAFLEQLRGQGTITNHEICLRRLDGNPVWVLENVSLVKDPHGTTVIDGTLLDITERKQAEQQLRLQAAALASAANAIAIADRAGRITWVNPAFTRLTGYAPGAVLGADSRAILTGEADPAARQAIWDAIQTGQVWQGEVVNQRQDGSVYTAEQTITPVRDEQGVITHFISIEQDIDERKRHEQRLDYLSRHDTLTGLLNRHALEQALDRAVLRARRGMDGTLLFLDLDSFKLVNDTLGHAAGDQLLISLGQILGQHLREGDLLARIGSDNFAVLLADAAQDEARRIAERLRETIQAYRFTLNDRRFMLGLSIGVVRIDGQHTTQTLMAQADMALHTAKDQGRNRVVLYNPAETNLAQLSKAHHWVTRIKEALWEDRFVLHFQPIVRLSDGAIAHYEVLLRMQHEDEGTELILPGTFIPAAERFGLMPAIDVWLVRQAIRTLHDHPDIHLFINLSGRSRGDEGLLELIETLLREYEVNPTRLGFELTETVAVQDLAQAKEWIGRLKALGCRFALDDFGVGYTSFAYLRSLPVDQIKIDGSFIRSLEQEASSREIVQTMQGLAQSLGKETVAEFVENETIYHLVRAMGLTYAQGFYLGQPGPELPRSLPLAFCDQGYVNLNRGPQPTNLV